MKTALLNYFDIAGGAARASYRIHQAMRGRGVDSTMCVNQADSGDWTVQGPANKWAKTLARLRPHFGSLLSKTLRTGNAVLHSPAFLPSSWSRRLNASDADVVHLHWVNGEMMSIADIGRLRKPMV